MTDPSFLPGVPADAIQAALGRLPGSDLDSPDSSAALVANTFGWFLTRPRLLLPLPGVPMGLPETVELGVEMQLPMRGTRHPRLDAVVTTPTTLVGIASKRYQPFRPAKTVAFTEPFDARDWGPGMSRFGALRKALTTGTQTYRHLDAVTLVKQAYALRTQGLKRARGAVLVYLHAEPQTWASGKPVDPKAIIRHRTEVASFARAVKGDDVTFVALTWAELLAQWAKTPALVAHTAAVKGWFGGL
ncbi:hypothetical protein [Tabrizicola aquatica]|uniref:hypothetical protein n=1 Tax=Tabrizicola aquatica TaxID=909926 RepID=UPI000CD2CFEA|nr:hypothetical protein [Tabrizicola aquatica]